MSVRKPSLCGLAARFVVLAIVVGLFFGGESVLFASAKRQNASGQEKDKKEEKKDEKKEEKKGLPLKSDRKIEFTTDEGTWLSLDVLPDGKTIVFELVGDLYTLPIAGGQAKLISGGMAFDSQPKVSPDGKWLYYAAKLGSLYYNQQLPTWHIARRDRKTGDEDDIINQIKSAFRPLLSPDGKQVLYATRYETESGLRLRNLETGADRWVKYPVTRDDQESLFTRDVFPGYAFLPGGKEIVYNQDGKIKRLDLATGTERIIPFTAQVSQELGPKLDFPQTVEQGPVKARLIMDPVESPDGKKLAFSAMTHLYTMDLPAGKPQRLIPGSAHEFQPAWSPDGKNIAYVTWSSQGGQLWKIRVAGGSPVQLSKSLAVFRNPRGAAEGPKLVLLRGDAHGPRNS